MHKPYTHAELAKTVRDCLDKTDDDTAAVVVTLDAAWRPDAPGDVTVAILSDIHHAGPAERARGEDYEFRTIANPLLRAVARAYRHLIWMRHPLDQGRQLDRFLAEIGPVDYVVANGDYPATPGLWA